ncbi:MAG: hypothetical protein ACP5QG_04355 [candidate division WOR-3 bacterium]
MNLVIILWQWLPMPLFVCLKMADTVVLAGANDVHEQGDTRWTRFLVLETIKGRMDQRDTFSLQFASRNTEGIWTSVFYPKAIYFKEQGQGETSLLLLSETGNGYTLYQYYPYAVLDPPAEDPGFVYRIKALVEFDRLNPDTGLIRECLGSEQRIFQESGLYLSKYVRDTSLAGDVRVFLESPDASLRGLAKENLKRWGLKWGK